MARALENTGCNVRCYCSQRCNAKDVQLLRRDEVQAGQSTHAELLVETSEQVLKVVHPQKLTQLVADVVLDGFSQRIHLVALQLDLCQANLSLSLRYANLSLRLSLLVQKTVRQFTFLS